VGLVPNVTLVDTANVGDTQLSIRGIVSTRDAESTFAYVVDGVLSTNPNSFNEELFDVQQIEVLKGPQGALYGRNAVAGAILVTTKAPSNEFEARVGGGVGNVGTWKANAMVSGPIVEDKLLGRIAVSTRSTDGFYENIFTNQDDVVDYLEDTSLRGRMIWNVSDDLQPGLSRRLLGGRGRRDQLQRQLLDPGLRRCLRRAELRRRPERPRLPVYLQHAGHQRAGDL
jgi:iron complex outermembrane receptor protein